jgi:hypothetical protein
MNDRIADTAFGAGGTATLMAWIGNLNEILQTVSLIVGIAATATAGLYYYAEWKKKRGR